MYVMNHLHELLAAFEVSSLGNCIIEGTRFFTSENDLIQIGILHRKKDTLIKPHFHRPSSPEKVSQEILILLDGKVQVTVYDTNENELMSRILYPGEIYLNYKAGHSFLFLEDSRFLEIKQGPYRAEDKVFIDPLQHEQMK